MNGEDDEGRSGGDMLSTLGLMLNLAAIISLALWLSMVGGTSHSGAAAVAGAVTLACFAASFACFAADHPTGRQSIRRTAGSGDQ